MQEIKNLTKELEKACEELNRIGHFNGIAVIDADCKSHEKQMEDCLSDGLTKQQAEQWCRDYCCAQFHLDDYDLFESDSMYVSIEFDRSKLESDFTAWLLPYIGDAACIMGELNLEGGDTEFMRPGAEFPLKGGE